ncbi:MAG: peptide ABC transporter permease [Hyphomicrobium sp.]|nr:peptide ABC transporter permease [Hyphomicrobium sp.]
MPVREGPPQPAPPKKYPAEKARQGQIILRTRTQRMIFVGGLVGAVLLALVLKFAGAFGA